MVHSVYECMHVLAPVVDVFQAVTQSHAMPAEVTKPRLARRTCMRACMATLCVVQSVNQFVGIYFLRCMYVEFL
jgi:hypothetical protein